MSNCGLFANYHTHTKRCGHAVGEDREYVEAAIESGIKVLGFSDHTPYPTGFHSGMRISLRDADGYFKSVEALRDEYKNDIKIHIGVEAEYFPEYFEGLLEFMKDYPLEYMILGQHFVPDEEHGMYVGAPFNDKSILDLYVENVIKGIDTGKFAYVAHPDLPNYRGEFADEYLKNAFERICKRAKEKDIPLEINMLGYVRKGQYPSDRFFEIAGKYGNDVIIGMDIHNPVHFDNPQAVLGCKQIAKKYGLRLLEKLEISK